MRILFLTAFRITDVNARGIYTDLMRKFRDEGHEVFIVSPSERRFGRPTTLRRTHGMTLLQVRTLNLQKTSNLVEKGVATLLVDTLYQRSIQRHFPDVRFDLVLYATPPITLTSTIEYIKRRDGAYAYLLLKDIFPQGAVDLGMLRSGSPMHRVFRQIEKKLFRLSDAIGCMSPANVQYVRRHNPEVDPTIVHVNPNSVAPIASTFSAADRRRVRAEHGIPEESTVFLYGGNLGKPQGIDFVLEMLRANTNRDGIFFVVVGSGTEYPRLAQWFESTVPRNALLMESLPKDAYDDLVQACDVGMIFLDRRFTIPNFPSRLLSFLEYGMPVLAATDTQSDIGTIAEAEGFGLWCESGDLETLNAHLQLLREDPSKRASMGKAALRYLLENYTVDHSYNLVIERLSSHGDQRRSPPKPTHPSLRSVPKRALDLLGAGVGLAVLSPVMLAASAAIYQSMGTPILFRQTRPGLNGTPFEALKFRTMSHDRDASGNLLPDAQRLTRVGRLLRSTSVDELPQLINVLRGDMSLVGPRPLLMDYLPLYSREQARRHDVKPGITGWAQVNGRNTITWEERFRHDVWYVDHQSFLLDLRILARTVLKTVAREGIDQDANTTMTRFEGSGTEG